MEWLQSCPWWHWANAQPPLLHRVWTQRDEDHACERGGNAALPGYVYRAIIAVLGNQNFGEEGNAAIALQAAPNAPTIAVTHNLPHANLPIGCYKKVFNLKTCVDSCAGINLGDYNFHMALAKLYPEVVSQIIDLVAIGWDIHIGGVDAHGTSIQVTHVISYWMPHYCDGAQACIAFGLSEKVAAMALVGIGFLRATNAICHFTRNETDLHLQAIGVSLDMT